MRHHSSTYRWAAVVCVGSLSVLANLYADTETPTSRIVTRVAGEPITVQFGDGRIATIHLGARPVTQLAIPLGVEESSCGTRVGMTCQLKIGLQVVTLTALWTAHPVAAKVGTPLKYLEQSRLGEQVTNQIYTSYDERTNKPRVVASMPSTELICSDYGWLPGAVSNAAPTEITFERWESEDMIENKETGARENRTTGGAAQMKFVRDSNGHLIMQSVGEFTSANSSPNTLAGNLYTLTIQQPGDERCQITLKPDLTATISAVIDYAATMPLSFEPYRWESDDYSSEETLRSMIRQLAEPAYIQNSENRTVNQLREFE